MVAGGMIKEQGMFLLSTLRYEKICANIYDTYCFFYMALLSWIWHFLNSLFSLVVPKDLFAS